MAVIKLNHRELKTKRFNLLTRALGGREDVALGVLAHLWLRSIDGRAVTFHSRDRFDFIVCPMPEMDNTHMALLRAGYLKPEGDQLRIVDTEAWIAGTERRIARSLKASKVSVAVRAKKTAKKKAAAGTTALAPAKAQLAKKQSQAHEMAEDGLLAARACWEAYSAAYSRQFGVMPIRNVKINSLIKQFIKRIPQWDAPHVLTFYVGHGNLYYAQRMYPLDMAVKDAESLHTQWVTNRQVTRATLERFEQNEKARVALEEGITF